MKPAIDSFYNDFGHKIDLLHQVRGGAVEPRLSIKHSADATQMTVRLTVPSIPAMMFFADVEPKWLVIGVRKQRDGQHINQCAICLERIGKVNEVKCRDGWIEVTVNH